MATRRPPKKEAALKSEQGYVDPDSGDIMADLSEKLAAEAEAQLDAVAPGLPAPPAVPADLTDEMLERARQQLIAKAQDDHDRRFKACDAAVQQVCAHYGFRPGAIQQQIAPGVVKAVFALIPVEAAQ